MSDKRVVPVQTTDHNTPKGEEAPNLMSLMDDSKKDLKPKQTVEGTLSKYNNGIYMKQRYEKMEELIACEYPNIYYVYERLENGQKGYTSELKFKDSSDCCDRLYTSGCKQYRMNVYYQYKDNRTDKMVQGAKAMVCKRSCKFACMCFGRRDMTIQLGAKATSPIIGKINELWDPLNYRYRLYTRGEDGKDKHCFNVLGQIFQCYFWCCCNCEMCKEVDFEIQDPETSERVGTMLRVGRLSRCILFKKKKTMLKDDVTDTYIIKWPASTTWQQRAVLMNAGAFIDYLLFEEGNEPEQAVTY